MTIFLFIGPPKPGAYWSGRGGERILIMGAGCDHEQTQSASPALGYSADPVNVISLFGFE